MPAIVVVALPEKNELVNEISSEKKAHMTLLYLDAPMGVNEEHIIQFVQFAAGISLKRFGLSVDRRGTLGPDDADVLFFDPERAQSLRDFRAELLKDDTIATHYVKTDQFPGWIPHLTLGYPAKPAKKVDRNDRYGLNFVSFDRIAVWTKDFDGPEFDLGESRDTMSDPVAWSDKTSPFLAHAGKTVEQVYNDMDSDKQALVDITVAAPDDEEFSDEELDDLFNIYQSMDDTELATMHYIVGQTKVDPDVAHSGVKGMHWGVRKDDTSASSRKKQVETLSSRIRNSTVGGVQTGGKGLISGSKKNLATGRATLGQAHIAALKTPGHRTANAFLGDKTYWKRTGIVALATAAGVGASFAAPGLMPAAMLIGIGGGHAVGIAGTSAVFVPHAAAYAAVGAQAVTLTGITATSAAAGAANTVNGLKNLKRALIGTAEINTSYEKLGKDVALHSSEASVRTAKMLSRNGSISRKKLMDESKVRILHSGVKGMHWGVRKNDHLLSRKDQGLNIHQRSQVKVAGAVSAIATAGITSNSAATLFQLQSRWEHLKIVQAVLDQAQNNPLLSEAGKEGLRQTKSKIVHGLITSALATTAISAGIGIVSHRTAKAYFAPIHKVYGDVKPRINGDLRKLSKDIKSGKRPKMTNKEYNQEVSKIVEKHMTADKKNVLQPFHELARSQLGLEYNTKKLDIRFDKLPNTNLYSKMTVVTPDGLKLVKAIKVVEHADTEGEPMPEVDYFFDYSFDADGFVDDFTCPTIEIANDLVNGTFDFEKTAAAVTEGKIEHSDEEGYYLAHFGIKGMRWGVRRPTNSSGLVTGSVGSAKSSSDAPAGRTSPGVGASRKSKVALDHKKLQKNVKKDVSQLSTDEIKQITNRLKAVKELKAVTDAQKEAQRSVGNKLARWALGAVATGAKQAGESYIKELTGDTIRDILPKTATQKAKDSKEKEKQQEKADKKAKEGSSEKTAREQAVRDLRETIADSAGVYKITDVLPRKGG